MSPSVQAAPATTPTTAPPAPTTTIIKFQNPTTTSTTVKKGATTTTVARTTSTTKASVGKSPTTTTSTTVATATPAQIAAMIHLANSVVRTAPNNDQTLLAALAPLEKQLGYTVAQAEVAGMGQFPVAGSASYTDDWLEYRATPAPHNHEGIDITAAMGTPIRAPVSGKLNYDTTDPDGFGLAAEVTGADRTEYVMAHMNATVTGLHSGSTVTEGQVIGFVGDSGDATGPHVHFEVHPDGGAGINPMPILNSWLKQAIAGIPALIATLSPATSTTATTAPAVIPSPRAPQNGNGGVPHSLAINLAKPKAGAGSVSDLAVVALLALLAASSLSLDRYRRLRSGPDGPPAGPPTPAH